MSATGIRHAGLTLFFKSHECSNLKHWKCVYFAVKIFAIGSSLYAFCMALETNILLGLITGKNSERAYLSMDGPGTLQRHIAYHVIINSYGLAITTWMNLTGAYGQSWTPWCYFSAPKYRVFFAYIPIWVAISGIVVLDLAVIRKTLMYYKLISRSRSRREKSYEGGSTGSAVLDGEQRSSYRMIRLIIRMILYPIALMLLLVPGFILRMCDWSGTCNFSSPLYWSLSKIQMACDPSAGTVIAVIWVLSDLNVRDEWADILHPYFRYCNWSRKGPNRKGVGVENSRALVTVTELSSVQRGNMNRSSGLTIKDTVNYVTENSMQNVDILCLENDDISILDGEGSTVSVVNAPWTS